jgi:hypothetical protein
VPRIGGDRPPPPTRVRGESFEKGRVFALFGGHGVGKSALLKIIAGAAETGVAVIAAMEADEESQQEVERAVVADIVADKRRGDAEVIFLDGCPRSVDDVQWLYDERLVAPAWGGCVVRVDRNAVVDTAFARALPAIEARLRDLSMPYVVIQNDDLERAVVNLLCRAGVTK